MYARHSIPKCTANNNAMIYIHLIWLETLFVLSLQDNIFHDLIKIFVSGCSLVSGLEPSSRGELRERLSLGLGLRHLDLTDVTRLDDLSLRLILQASGACMEFLYLRRCANITGGWRPADTSSSIYTIYYRDICIFAFYHALVNPYSVLSSRGLELWSIEMQFHTCYCLRFLLSP